MNIRNLHTLCLALSVACTLAGNMAAEAKPRYITYEKFGAKGDGVTDDMPAIVAAHKAANEKGLPVRAKAGRTYFIGKAPLTAEIRTDTDWGKARFVIDDVDTPGIKTPVFVIAPDLASFHVKGLTGVRRGQTDLGITLPCRCLVEIVNEEKKVFIRKGRNQNNGTAQREVLLVGEDGTVDPATPVVFDYGKITKAKAWPADEKPITVRGGIFTTIANQCASEYTYHARGITVKRSGARLEGITHLITGELDHGAPYRGFIALEHVTGVTVTDCVLTGHKTYIKEKGAAGLPVSMGSYDLNATSCAHILWKNCRQTNSIDDRTYWGTFTSNFCKDLTVEDCSLSRFDAHQGVTNVTLRNCTFGHMGVRMVGFGTLLVENCEVRCRSLVSLRSDYGSTWEGDIILRGCTLRPSEGVKNLAILSGSNDGSHDFGYPCRLPFKVIVERLLIDDASCEGIKGYGGPAAVSSFGRKAGSEEPFPFGTDCTVTLSAVTVSSGRPLVTVPNPEAFPGLTVAEY